MKKLLAISMVGMLFLSVALPPSWAVEDEATETGMSGTPQDFSDLQKTLKQDRIDDLERRVAGLEQANQFLSNRVQDLERSVYDFKSRQ
jgi:hypothetical protein